MERSLELFANELLPIAERFPRDPEFIFRLRAWDWKYICREVAGLAPSDELEHSDLFGIHRFLFETDPDNFPITVDSVKQTRNQVERHLAGDLKWTTDSVTSYLLPELLVYHSPFGLCRACQGFLNYWMTKSHGIIYGCDSCSAEFPLSSTEFGLPDRFKTTDNVLVLRPATLRELQFEKILPNAV